MGAWADAPVLFENGVRLLGTALKLGIILALTLLACSFVRRMASRMLKAAVQRASSRGEGAVDELAKRYETVGTVTTKTAVIVVWTIAGFTALSQLGIDIAPILAGAGVLGIAVGFGAQTLVRDVIAGLFIILENQYGKGDVVKIVGIGGLVEEVNLRRTILRDLGGTVHHVPNGEVRIASNLTREWSRVNFNVSVAYREDLDRVMAVVSRVGAELAADDYFGSLIVEPPKALRVDAFEDSGISIKVLGVVKPMKQWEVMGEMRRRLKRAFDEESIEIPFPQRVLYLRHQGERQTSGDGR